MTRAQWTSFMEQLEKINPRDCLITKLGLQGGKRINEVVTLTTEKKKWQTHTLLELPKGLTLRPFIYDAKGENQPWIDYVYDPIITQHGDKALAKTEYVFITNTLADKNTKGKKFDIQKRIIAKQAGYVGS